MGLIVQKSRISTWYKSLMKKRSEPWFERDRIRLVFQVRTQAKTSLSKGLLVVAIAAVVVPNWPSWKGSPNSR